MSDFIPLISFPLGPKESTSYFSIISACLGSSLGCDWGCCCQWPRFALQQRTASFLWREGRSWILSHTRICLLRCISLGSLWIQQSFPAGRLLCFQFSVDWNTERTTHTLAVSRHQALPPPQSCPRGQARCPAAHWPEWCCFSLPLEWGITRLSWDF